MLITCYINMYSSRVLIVILLMQTNQVSSENNWPHVVSNASRLAISILVSMPRENDSSMTYLRASLFLLSKNLFPYTPADVLIFTLSQNVKHLNGHIRKLADLHSNIIVVPILSQQWKIPTHLTNESLWRLSNLFAWEYRMMGEWRITMQMR